MDKNLSVALSDAPSKTFRPLQRLPAYAHALPGSLYSQLNHEGIHIVCQSWRNMRSYSEQYYFRVEERWWISIQIQIPLTFFMALPDVRLALFNHTFPVTRVNWGRYVALHLPAGEYFALFEPGIFELFYSCMPYGLLVHHCQNYPFLMDICSHWKQAPHVIRLFDLGSISPTRAELSAAIFDRPEYFFSHLNLSSR